MVLQQPKLATTPAVLSSSPTFSTSLRVSTLPALPAESREANALLGAWKQEVWLHTLLYLLGTERFLLAKQLFTQQITSNGSFLGLSVSLR